MKRKRRLRAGDYGMLIWMAFVAIAMVAFLTAGAWAVPESRAVDALENAGYTNIEVEGRDWFFVSVRGCSRDDVVQFTGTATNPIGKRVHWAVCVGWPFKGATIRG